MKSIQNKQPLSVEATKWLDDFSFKHGRKLRVLHLGNIANNAYINAKIMRRIGIEADVICPDYYHIMGCPEWEDADFESDKIDAFNPKWGKVNLNGYKRPSWFVQGPRNLAYKYLDFKNRGEVNESNAMKILLDLRAFGFKYIIFNNINKMFSKSLYKSLMVFALAFYYAVLKKLRGWFVAWIIRVVVSVVHNTRKITMKSSSSVWYVTIRDKFYELMNSQNYNSFDIDKESCQKVESNVSLNEELLSLTSKYMDPAKIFYSAARHYDFIISYSTEGLYPLLAGMDNFASYEHGTIRDIPFENTEQGRLCSLTYQKSPAVFITNTDCVAMADRLGIERDRQYWMPHALDTHKIFSIYDEMRPKITLANNPPVFFSPARQHWQVDDSGLGKGNDRVIHAAKRLSDEGLDFKVEFIEWGQDVDASKKLIAELGIEKHFNWAPSMRKRELLITYLRASAVIDQFVFPAMGGVTFEALAMGRPVISYLDADQVGEFFGEVPPLHNCSTANEVAKAMKSVICDSKTNIALGEAAQNWVRKYHSSERVLEIQIGAISKILDASHDVNP